MAWIDAETEDDLDARLANEEVSPDEHAALVALLREPLDINAASRDAVASLPGLTPHDVEGILSWRHVTGGCRQIAELGVILSPAHVRALRPFVRCGVSSNAKAFAGGTRIRARYVPPDRRMPPLALETDLVWSRLRAGVTVLLDRFALRSVRYDPTEQAWVTPGPAPQLSARRYVVAWHASRWQLLAGTYSVGFAQRLTFDTTSRTAPHGVYPELALQDGQGLAASCPGCTPDYDTAASLHGLALTLGRLPLRRAGLDLHAWISASRPRIYQYDLMSAEACEVEASGDLSCPSPRVLDANTPLSYQHLPGVAWHLLGGANATVHLGPRTRVGLRGYGASTVWARGQRHVDYRPSARIPSGGPYGAAGVDVAWGRRRTDLFLELSYAHASTRSLPYLRFAAIAGHRATWDRHAIEWTARAYGPGYENPHAGPIAAADEYEGLRARDELGLRVRYDGRLAGRTGFGGRTGVGGRTGFGGRLSATFDLWSSWTRPRPQLLAAVRQGWRIGRRTELWIEASFQDRDLRAAGPKHCFEGASADGCRGEATRLLAGLRLTPHPRVSLRASYRHRISGAPDLGGIRHDGAAALELRARPVDAVRLRLRGRWSHAAMGRGEGEHLLHAGGSIDVFPGAKTALGTGYDITMRLDAGASEPNPQHWLAARLELRF